MQNAERLETDFVALAVWDGREGDGLGGTASVIQRWRDINRLDVDIIDLTELLKEAKHPAATMIADVSRPRRRKPQSAAGKSIEVRAIMFADVQNFTALTEEQMPAFVERFLYMIGAKAAVSPDRPMVQESRGDGVFFVFADIGSAGRFALDLNNSLRSTPWQSFGLPKDLNVRIALHAGPIYGYVCPFSKLPTYTGNHVNRAARIEPVTPIGEVYASREFAALCCESGVQDFTCQYAGLAPLAKNYGLFPLYHVRRRGRSN